MQDKYVLWQLSDKGFQYMLEDLGSLESYEYLSRAPFHDSIVNAFHLGYWLYAKPPDVELYTEQELNANFFTHYPNWVPKSKAHRPDGYTLINNGSNKNVFAIEVELHQKTIDRYKMACDFYDERDEVLHVLWLVKGSANIKKIQESFGKRNQRRKDCHLFFDFDDFKINSWDTKVLTGQKTGMTVAAIYQQFASNITSKLLAIRGQFDPKMTFLKPVKSPQRLNT
jgi:hypothetical protein